jgi:hypothetical protein
MMRFQWRRRWPGIQVMGEAAGGGSIFKAECVEGKVFIATKNLQSGGWT